MGITAFRSLLIAVVVFSVGAIVADVFFATVAMEAAEEAIETVAPVPDAPLVALLLLVVGGLGLSAVALVGLWFFWAPARVLLGVAMLAGLPLYFLIGTMVTTPLSQIFSDLELMTTSLVFSLAYWSPLSERFKGHGSRPRVPLMRADEGS